MSKPRFETLQAKIIRSFDPILAASAQTRWLAAQPHESVASLPVQVATQSGGAELHEVSRLWLALPDKWRFEATLSNVDRPFIQVVNGAKWWLFNPLDKEARTRMGIEEPSSPIITQAPPFALLWDRELIDLFFIRERVGVVTVGGRKQIKERAVPRPSSSPTEELGLWPNASFHELSVDDEYGIVIEWTAYLDKQILGRIVVENPLFDEPLQDELFELGRHRSRRDSDR
jgi:hypothetical protein